jgi:hypothetical protein
MDLGLESQAEKYGRMEDSDSTRLTQKIKREKNEKLRR